MQCSGDRVQALWGLLGVRLLSHHACAATLQTAPATMKSFKLPPQPWKVTLLWQTCKFRHSLSTHILSSSPGLLCRFVKRGTTVYHSNSNHQNEGFLCVEGIFCTRRSDQTKVGSSFRLSWSPLWGLAPSAKSELVSKRRTTAGNIVNKTCKTVEKSQEWWIQLAKSGLLNVGKSNCQIVGKSNCDKFPQSSAGQLSLPVRRWWVWRRQFWWWNVKTQFWRWKYKQKNNSCGKFPDFPKK